MASWLSSLKERLSDRGPLAAIAGVAAVVFICGLLWQQSWLLGVGAALLCLTLRRAGGDELASPGDAREIEPVTDGTAQPPQRRHDEQPRHTDNTNARTARVFMMREHLGQETGEICKELGITPTHCWVMLYRARMTLRECLQQTWFGR